MYCFDKYTLTYYVPHHMDPLLVNMNESMAIYKGKNRHPDTPNLKLEISDLGDASQNSKQLFCLYNANISKSKMTDS